MDDLLSGLVATAMTLVFFGLPVLIANRRPELFRGFLFLLGIGGSLAIAAINGAWSIYNDGFRAALDMVDSDAAPEPLWGLDPVLLAKCSTLFWLYVAGVWVYGRFKLPASDTKNQ